RRERFVDHLGQCVQQAVEEEQEAKEEEEQQEDEDEEEQQQQEAKEEQQQHQQQETKGEEQEVNTSNLDASAKVRSSEYIPEDQPMETTTPSNTGEAEDDGSLYPPKGEELKHKRLPPKLPDHLRKHTNEYPQFFIPDETFCTVCPGTIPLGG
ncbi:uncharacterized protein LOC115550974, partial [Scomber scombrus]